MSITDQIGASSQSPGQVETLELTGKVKRFFAQRESFSAGRFTLSPAHRRKHPGVWSELPFKAYFLIPRGEIRVVGRWPVFDERWGSQLVIEEASSLADELTWLHKELEDLPGIGPSTVQQLRTRFGADLVAGLDSGSLGLSGPKRETILTWWGSLGPWLRELRRGLRTAGVPGPVRARVEAYLREKGDWGRWVEIATGLEEGA